MNDSLSLLVFGGVISAIVVIGLFWGVLFFIQKMARAKLDEKSGKDNSKPDAN